MTFLKTTEQHVNNGAKSIIQGFRDGDMQHALAEGSSPSWKVLHEGGDDGPARRYGHTEEEYKNVGDGNSSDEEGSEKGGCGGGVDDHEDSGGYDEDCGDDDYDDYDDYSGEDDDYYD
ncbi:hypothetical protein TruAng_010145 [Truncatella angustata]|nr:hypothetical protein TruAng_010145 [Truncatella angustata]